ncbi:LysE family transporter [Micromonospora sonneratiae]|jgi:arginine exporter protein ArgO|uniref:LysE family transporter n=1 Tax=Micromonospora sonneratiae TaxID=1184706 RepID=A0ABW3YKV0_9ACTN
MIDALLAGLLAGYGVAVPVGAIAILVMGLAARTSLRVGVAAAMGVATADGIYAVVAVLGGAALAGLIEPVAGPLRWVAAAILVALAGHTAVAAIRRYGNPAPAARSGRGLATPGRAYAGLLALTMLNPMTVVYFAALVLGRQTADGMTFVEAMVFAVAALVASASWQLLVATGGSLVGRLLTGARGQLFTALGSSVLIVALVVGMLLPR